MTYFGINYLINHLVIHKSKPEFKPSSVWIAGDSHLQTSIDPSLFNSASNIAMLAEPVVVTYFKLKFLFSFHKPDTLIMGFSQHTISAFNDLKFSDIKWSNEMFRRTYAIINPYDLNGLIIDYHRYYKTLFRYMCLYPRTDHFDFIGSYQSVDANYAIDVDAAIDRHFYANGKKLGVSQLSISYIDSIINLCKKENVKLIFVASPVHKNYYERIPFSSMQNYKIELKRKEVQGIKFIDLSHQFYIDKYYMDADHLNAKGARLFTTKLINLLREDS